MDPEEPELFSRGVTLESPQLLGLVADLIDSLDCAPEQGLGWPNFRGRHRPDEFGKRGLLGLAQRRSSLVRQNLVDRLWGSRVEYQPGGNGKRERGSQQAA